VVAWPIVRDEQPAAVGEPHVGLDLVAAERDRLLERGDRVLRCVAHRAAVADPSHQAILAQRRRSSASPVPLAISSKPLASIAVRTSANRARSRFMLGSA